MTPARKPFKLSRLTWPHRDMLPDHRAKLTEYLQSGQRDPLFLAGDALELLHDFPAEWIDCCMTSPPYWGQRAYRGGGIGLESDHHQYVEHLLTIFVELK